MSINIARTNIANYCTTKCAYSFDYNECGLNKTVLEQQMTYKFNPIPSVPPVLYNKNQYTPDEIRISHKSFYKYNGNQVDAQLIIIHSPVNGGNNMCVCIPIIQSTDTSAASILIGEMITTINQTIKPFSLNTIIPMNPFYSYTKDNIDFIVFGLASAIPLSASIFETLKNSISITEPETDDTTTKVFYNSDGPKSTLAGQGIYIDCQPTGSSGEVDIVKTMNPPIYDLDTVLKDPTVFMIVQLLMSCLIFIIIYFLISYGFAFMTSTDVRTKTVAK